MNIILGKLWPKIQKLLHLVMRFITLLLFLMSTCGVYCQTADQIINDQSYIKGIGVANTIYEADHNALADLTSQISVNVESTSEMKTVESTVKGNGQFNQNFNALISTYSSVTLANTGKITMSDEPKAKVLRYIKKSEISKIFESREDKIYDLFKSGKIAERNNQIADALRNYYWSLTLINSLPYPNTVKDSSNVSLITLIPNIIDDILLNVSFAVEKINETENVKVAVVKVAYKSNPVINIDYKYWDGANWSGIIGAKDGIGAIELVGISKELKEVRVKLEYEYRGEARIDKEIESTLAMSRPIIRKKNEYVISLVDPVGSKSQKIEIDKDFGSSNSQIQKIIKLLNSKSNAIEASLFNSNGLQVYKKLIEYGNAIVIESDDLSFYEFQDKVYCRGVKMLFKFNNNKQFVEDVTFELNADDKISNLSFSLNKIAIDDINGKSKWGVNEKATLIHFLENYKTAYALKRLNFIESIFGDEALIIVGYKVDKNQAEGSLFDNDIFTYHKYLKKEFISRLSYSFNSKEFINLKFEKSEIKQSAVNDKIFGIQIKQNYYSSNYGDQGYLFLLVDFADTNKPIIHVRTWQTEIDNDGNVYGLGDF